MESLRPAFGIRDYLSYLFPGIVLLSAYPLIYPNSIAEIITNPILSSIFILVVGYIGGHICKALSDYILEPIRSWLGLNPYKIALGPQKREWRRSFNNSLIKKLRMRWGDELIPVKWDEHLSRSAGVILLCWYDTMKSSSQFNEEIARYLVLFNLAKSLTSACIFLGITASFVMNWPILVVSIIGMITFILYWYRYEYEFAKSILRAWFVNSDNK